MSRTINIAVGNGDRWKRRPAAGQYSFSETDALIGRHIMNVVAYDAWRITALTVW